MSTITTAVGRGGLAATSLVLGAGLVLLEAGDLPEAAVTAAMFLNAPGLAAVRLVETPACSCMMVASAGQPWWLAPVMLGGSWLAWTAACSALALVTSRATRRLSGIAHGGHGAWLSPSAEPRRGGAPWPPS